jgi:hypothetical protein
MQTACTVSPPKAKRIKLGKAGQGSSLKSPAKAKRTVANRNVRGRLQDMLSLSFDVLFLVWPCYLASHLSLNNLFLRYSQNWGLWTS